MTLRDIAIIPLNLAVLCIDCETVSNSKGGTCPACGSIAIINMQRVWGVGKKEAA